jgi:Zn-dependent protease with chaperone function
MNSPPSWTWTLTSVEGSGKAPTGRIWKGRYLDGKSAAVHEVALRPYSNGIRIELSDGTVLDWPYSEIRQEQGRYEGEPVRLERGSTPTEVLVVQETDFLYGLRAWAGTKAGRFHNPEFRKKRPWLTLYAGLVTLVVCFVAYKWGIPALAHSVAQKVPVSWEKGLGDSVLAQLAPPEKRLKDPALDLAVRRILARLTATVPDCPYRFDVTVCDIPVVNAFALPGGHIVVFKGLLHKTKTAEELAGVLAHEMQHVLQKHSTQRILQSLSTGLLISAMSGDVTGSVAFGLEGARTLALLEYGRGEEEESDREGMAMVLAAGIDPNGMVRFFQELKKLDKMPDFMKYISTHPATGDRIEALTQQAKGKGPKGEALPAVKIAYKKDPEGRRELLPDVQWPALVKGPGRTK